MLQAQALDSTHIRTPDETLLIMPNSLLVKERVVNQSRPTRHLTTRVDVSVGYGSNLPEVPSWWRPCSPARNGSLALTASDFGEHRRAGLPKAEPKTRKGR